MADNAPFSANRPPYPNLHMNLPGRLEQYLITALGANGSVALVNGQSSAGCTVTYVGEGNYAFSFPLGGTGAIGYVQILPPEVAGEAATDPRAYSIDSDILNFATGLGRFSAISVTTDGVLADIIGTFRIVVTVLRPAS
jgi:hypothetical protein